MTPSDLLTQIGAAIATQTSGNSAELPSRELTGLEVEAIWNEIETAMVRATREATAPSVWPPRQPGGCSEAFGRMLKGDEMIDAKYAKTRRRDGREGGGSPRSTTLQKAGAAGRTGSAASAEISDTAHLNFLSGGGYEG